jgi:hypothetical protein
VCSDEGEDLEVLRKQAKVNELAQRHPIHPDRAPRRKQPQEHALRHRSAYRDGCRSRVFCAGSRSRPPRPDEGHYPRRFVQRLLRFRRGLRTPICHLRPRFRTAKNVLECCSGEARVKGLRLDFVCRSLGGLMARLCHERRFHGLRDVSTLPSILGKIAALQRNDVEP